MRRFNLFLTVITLVSILYSCNETKVEEQDLRADVKFNLLVEEDNEMQIKPTNKSATIEGNPILDRDALEKCKIKESIKELKITATHAAETNSKNYTVADGEGETSISMNNLPVGNTHFLVETESYVQTPETDPNGSDCDGFSSGTSYSIDYDVLKEKYKWCPDILTPVSSANLAECLRAIPPFVQFKGETDEHLNFCETNQSCNKIDVTMYPKQGRMIATVAFENCELAKHYKASCKFIHDCDDSYAPEKLTWINYVDQPVEAWFYLSNESVVEGKSCKLEIRLYEENSIYASHTWVLDENNPKVGDNLKIENGKDKWLDVIITEEGLRSTCNTFDLTWIWGTEDTNIHL